MGIQIISLKFYITCWSGAEKRRRSGGCSFHPMTNTIGLPEGTATGPHVVDWLSFLGTYDRSEFLLSARVDQIQTERQTDTRHVCLSAQQIYVRYTTTAAPATTVAVDG